MSVTDKPLGGTGPMGGSAVGIQRSGLTPTVKHYPSGSYTFLPTASGWYRFVLWGPGGRGGAGPLGGGGGGFILADRYLAAGQAVTIVVGLSSGSLAGTDTIVTLPGGEVMTAGAGKEFNDGVSPAGGGVATSAGNLDTKTPGTTGTTLTGGVGASTSDLIAGAASVDIGVTPAGGAGPAAGAKPGNGLVMIIQIKLRA